MCVVERYQGASLQMNQCLGWLLDVCGTCDNLNCQVLGKGFLELSFPSKKSQQGQQRDDQRQGVGRKSMKQLI